MHIFDTVIAETSKGHRVWIQGLAAHGWQGGSRYTTDYNCDQIILMKALPDWTGKTRKVTDAKGGIIDLEGKRITAWAKGSQSVTVDITANTIIITRVAA